jgi:hypothetical protein
VSTIDKIEYGVFVEGECVRITGSITVAADTALLWHERGSVAVVKRRERLITAWRPLERRA